MEIVLDKNREHVFFKYITTCIDYKLYLKPVEQIDTRSHRKKVSLVRRIFFASLYIIPAYHPRIVASVQTITKRLYSRYLIYVFKKLYVFFCILQKELKLRNVC